jgi:YidC/Oxa1 family membrane protein insertase
MRTEFRFLLAIGLMLVVLIGTNVLFPPERPEPPATETPTASIQAPPPDEPSIGAPDANAPRDPLTIDSLVAAATAGLPEAPPPTRTVTVVGPLYQYEFTTRGAALRSLKLPLFRSLRTEGPVELIPEEFPALGYYAVSGADTIDLSLQPFSVSPEDGLNLQAGGAPQTLTFKYSNPSGSFGFEVAYTFSPDSYVIDAVGRVTAAERPLVLTSLGHGLAFNEADSTGEARSMAYVGNHVNEGIRSQPLQKVEEPRVEPGPFLWAAFRSKFFVMAMLPRGEAEEPAYFGGLLVRPQGRERASVAVAQATQSDGSFSYRLLAGPQNYSELQAIGNDLDEVNPYGWRWIRPVVRPFVSIITTVLIFMHNSLGWGYGWVLILFGLLMRVLLWPFNQKAMKAQMRNMAVQPLVKEIQVKYKDKPEKMQEEMLRLYKEYGFNPMAGCLPMLLPWPILIALFFVFQNTIEFRGVPFLWLPDLSAPDPLYVLPVFLAISMFALQYMSYKSMDQDNPQMKMMMWTFPLLFGFLFMQFAAGLNLYYSISNVATLPQQWWIAKERKKVVARGPQKVEHTQGRKK